MIHKLTDISDQDLYEFLSYCMYPAHDRITRECNSYKTQMNRELYGIYSEKTLSGIIGLIHNDFETELKHIAVHPHKRNKGLGSKLIEEIIKLNTIHILVAETDKHAVHFYKKIGFEIISLGEKYPGVERFKCVYSCKNERTSNH